MTVVAFINARFKLLMMSARFESVAYFLRMVQISIKGYHVTDFLTLTFSLQPSRSLGEIASV